MTSTPRRPPRARGDAAVVKGESTPPTPATATVSVSVPDDDGYTNDAERERAAIIARNRRMLEEMGVMSAAASLSAHRPLPKKRGPGGLAGATKRHRDKGADAPPPRRSGRVAGLAAAAPEARSERKRSAWTRP